MPRVVTAQKVKITGLKPEDDWFQQFEADMADNNYEVMLEGSAGDDVYAISNKDGGAVDVTVDTVKGILNSGIVTQGWTLKDVEIVGTEYDVTARAVGSLTIYEPTKPGQVAGYVDTTVVVVANGSHVEQSQEFFDDPGGVTVRYSMPAGTKSGSSVGADFSYEPTMPDQQGWVNYSLVDVGGVFGIDAAADAVRDLGHAVAILTGGQSTTKTVVNALKSDGFTTINMCQDRPARPADAEASGEEVTVPNAELVNYTDFNMEDASDLDTIDVGLGLMRDGKEYKVTQVNADNIVIREVVH